MTTDAPRLLFVSHHFPPDISIGSKRSHRIASQMVARGWQVDVLCARDIYQDGHDSRLMAGLEAVNIVRTHELNPRAWARWARDRATGGRRSGAGQTDSAPASLANGDGRVQGHGLLLQLRAALSEGAQWLEFPDEWGGWFPHALTAAQRLERPDVVLATVPVATAALVATAIGGQFDVPVVLDYRDPWHAAARKRHLPVVRRELETQLETICHQQAAALVTVTPGLVDEIGGQFGRHVHLIPNACEPERLAGIKPRSFSRPTLVYAGALYGGRSVVPVLDSLARLRQAGDLESTPLALLVMGTDNDHIPRDAAARGIGDLVEVLPRQSYTAAMAAALGATANLLIVAPEHKVQVPAKVFEQMGVGRPILGLGPKGADIEHVLAEVSVARWMQPDDGDAIDAALRDLVGGDWRGGKQAPAAYTVAATMDNLDDLLRRVSGHRRTDRSSPPSITLAATGDLMLPSRVLRTLEADPRGTMGPAGEALRAADIAFGNLETPIVRDASPRPSSNPLQPVFIAPEAAAAWLREAGYSVLNLANNHIADAGDEGIIETLAACRAAGILTVGAGRNLADARRPAVVEVAGRSVGVLGYSSFETATPRSPGSAPIHLAGMAADVARLRREVDHVIVSLHAGIEYAELPTSGFRDICHALVRAGADLVLGHHPHVYQGHERVGDGMVVYSLGNTLADTIDPETKRLAFERTMLVLSGLRDLRPDEPRLEDVVVVSSRLEAGPVDVEVTLHRLREDLRISAASASEKERFGGELEAQLRALASDDPRMEKFDRLELQSSVGAALNFRNIVRRFDRIRPRHIGLGARWLAARVRGN
jgi:poly-gamma-glutamate capsule biosynthesis protein CapA/YwtB (metallophosphatase superfamily)